MTTEEIKERIAQYEEIINDASEDQTTRDFAQKKVDKLKEQIADGDDDAEEIDEADSGELEVDEIYGDGDEEFQEEVEEAEATPTKPGPKEKKKKTTKTKGRGRPKKRGRPAKRKATKKAAPTKAKAKKMSKDLGLSVKECEDLLEKYNSEDKARKSRLSKRKKAGKSAELSVSESLEKEVKTVKNKVEDKKTATTKTQAKSQGNKITELVKAILQGIDKKQDKIKQIDAIIKGLVAEKKSIMAKKGVGSFLVGTALGGYAGYKAGLSEDKTELKDLFKGEKKLAKDFKEAVKDKRKKDDSYTEFEEIYAKGGKIDRDEPIVEYLVRSGEREHTSLFRPKDYVITFDNTDYKFIGKRDATVEKLKAMDEEKLVQLMYGEDAEMTEEGVDIGDAYVEVYNIMTMGEFIDRGYAKGGEIGWKSMDDRKLESLNETAIRFFNQLSEKGKEQYKQELMRLKKAFPYKSGTENWTMVVNQMNGFDEEYGEGTLGMRRNISASEYRYGLQIMALESSMKDNGLKEYAEGGTTYDEIQDEKIYNNLGGINNNLKGIQNLYQKNPSLKMASGGKTESNIDDAMFGMDKWLSEDDDSIREFQEIEDDGDVKDMIEYLNSYSDEEVLYDRYGVTSSDFPAIAKKIMKKSSQNKLIKEEEGRVEYKDYLVKGINGEEKTIEVPVDAYDFLTSDDDTKLTYFNPNEEDEDGYDYLETVNIGFPTDIQHFAKGGVPQNAKWKYPIYFGSEGKEYLAIYYSNEEDVNEADEDFDNRTANDLTPDVIKEFVDDTSSSKSNYKREERDFYELSKNDKFMDELGYALETSSISPEKVDYAKGGEIAFNVDKGDWYFEDKRKGIYRGGFESFEDAYEKIYNKTPYAKGGSVSEKDKKRYNIDEYSSHSSRISENEYMERTNDFDELVEKITKRARDKKIPHIEIYYKDSFIGSINDRDNYKFRIGRGFDNNPLKSKNSSINKQRYKDSSITSSYAKGGETNPKLGAGLRYDIYGSSGNFYIYDSYYRQTVSTSVLGKLNKFNSIKDASETLKDFINKHYEKGGTTYAEGGYTNTWGGIRGRLNIPQLSFDKVDYDVNVNGKNLEVDVKENKMIKNYEVDVNIKERDSVNHSALNDTDAEWSQHNWGYMVYPKSIEQLYDVLKALRTRVSKKRLNEWANNSTYAKGGTTYDKGQDNQIEDNTEDIENNKEEIDHYGMASSDALGLAQENEQTIDNMRQGTNKVLNNLYKKNPSLKMAKGGKTPKFKVRKSFYDELIEGSNKKTGTGEDMRSVYHLRSKDKNYSDNFLMEKMTDQELKNRAPQGYDEGFYVDEEVYVDFTDKEGKKKKGYMLVNNPDLAVRILRDRYGAVSVEDITMEWEMGDKGKNFEDYTNSF